MPAVIDYDHKPPGQPEADGQWLLIARGLRSIFDMASGDFSVGSFGTSRKRPVTPPAERHESIAHRIVRRPFKGDGHIKPAVCRLTTRG